MEYQTAEEFGEGPQKIEAVVGLASLDVAMGDWYRAKSEAAAEDEAMQDIYRQRAIPYYDSAIDSYNRATKIAQVAQLRTRAAELGVLADAAAASRSQVLKKIYRDE